MFELIIKFILDILTFGSLTIFIFSMFKLPIKNNDKQIVIFAIVVGFVNFYFKVIIQSPYFFLFQVISFIILLVVLRNYPILYALVLSITGFIATSLIETIVALLGPILTSSTIQEMVSHFPSYALLHMIIAGLYIFLSYILTKNKVGFSFVKRRFSSKVKISSINYIWSSLLIVAMMVLTILTQPRVVKSLNMYIILIVGALFIISIWYAYRQNKFSLNERYGVKDANNE